MLGKPFWALPDSVPDPSPGMVVAQKGDAVDGLLVGRENLPNTLVSIRGMDDFFVYQLTYKRVRLWAVCCSLFRACMRSVRVC